jgi:hypothetical protein
VGTVVVVGGVMATIMRLRPYVPAKAWKMPVKLLLLSISLLSALLNMVSFASEGSPSLQPAALGLGCVFLWFIQWSTLRDDYFFVLSCQPCSHAVLAPPLPSQRTHTLMHASLLPGISCWWLVWCWWWCSLCHFGG